MALQPKLGILSERRAGDNRTNSSGLVFVRPNLTVTGNFSSNECCKQKKAAPFGAASRTANLLELPAKSKRHG